MADPKHKNRIFPDKQAFELAEQQIRAIKIKQPFYLSKKETGLSHSFIVLDDTPYAITGRIGKGGINYVKLCQNKQGQKFTLKIRQEKHTKVKRTKQLITFEVLAALGRLKGHFVKKGKAYVLLTYFKGQDFNQFLKKDPLQTNNSHDFLLKLCLSVKALHKQGIIHGDIKENNFIINQGRLTVIDFDASLKVGRGETRDKPQHWITNKKYVAPEVKNHKFLDMKSDVYALGGIVKNFIHNHKILMGESNLARLINAVDIKRLTKLARGMTKPKLNERLSLSDAISKLIKIKDKQKQREHRTIFGMNIAISAAILGVVGATISGIALAIVPQLLWCIGYGRNLWMKESFNQIFSSEDIESQVEKLDALTKQRIQSGYECSGSLAAQALTWLKPSTYHKDYYLGLRLAEVHPQIEALSFSP